MLARLFVVVVTAIASFCLVVIAATSFAWTLPDPIARFIAMAIAIAGVVVVWSWMSSGGRDPNAVSQSMALYGFAVGGVAFAAGFCGPIAFSQSPQGPLLGIFITGPLGFVAGLIIGAIKAHRSVKKTV